MNKYLKKWINETYPLMGDDIEELDHFDLQKFADWMEKQLTIPRVVGQSEQLKAFIVDYISEFEMEGATGWERYNEAKELIKRI